MNKKVVSSFAVVPLLLVGWGAAIAQDEEEKPPYVVPVDTFTCTYNDGKGPKDLDKVVAAWNAHLDEEGVDDYAAMTVTPNYYGQDTFQVGWLGWWTSQEAMGAGIDSYRAGAAGKFDPMFAEVISCDTHSHYASVQVKSPPEGEMPDNLVLMFSNCTRNDEVEWDDLWDRIGKGVEYMESHGYNHAAFMMWPVFGGEGEPEWDFKWVNVHENYTEFGKAYQHNANGGGRQAMNEIMDNGLDCDPARVYDAKVVRKITAQMDE